ncbi:hypothetical protein ACIPL1_18595 [Pseudomonas sp. NPDC090202]|uniref:hypothetical protein n=1 Tax=unclassified Pseudomonas TaxID=196821 RepID=UPI00380497A0
MRNPTGIPGGTENAIDSIEPLEPGRPDVIPLPPLDGDDLPSEEEEVPASPQEEAERQKALQEVERNNSFAAEHPGEI